MTDTLKTLRRLAPEAAEALERVDRFNFANSSAAAQALFIVHCSADMHCFCAALAEALAALEPLAAFAQAYLNGALDDQLIKIVRIGAPTPEPQNWADITVGDARRAAEVLEKVQ